MSKDSAAQLQLIESLWRRIRILLVETGDIRGALAFKHLCQEARHGLGPKNCQVENPDRITHTRNTFGGVPGGGPNFTRVNVFSDQNDCHAHSNERSKLGRLLAQELSTLLECGFLDDMLGLLCENLGAFFDFGTNCGLHFSGCRRRRRRLIDRRGEFGYVWFDSFGFEFRGHPLSGVFCPAGFRFAYGMSEVVSGADSPGISFGKHQVGGLNGLEGVLGEFIQHMVDLDA